jgi:hypothetical protein
VWYFPWIYLLLRKDVRQPGSSFMSRQDFTSSSSSLSDNESTILNLSANKRHLWFFLANQHCLISILLLQPIITHYCPYFSFHQWTLIILNFSFIPSTLHLLSLLKVMNVLPNHRHLFFISKPVWRFPQPMSIYLLLQPTSNFFSCCLTNAGISLSC